MPDVVEIAADRQSDSGNSDLPESLTLELTLKSPDLILELTQFPDDARTEYALGALRIGILALRQARGQVDTDAVRRECDRMLRDVEKNLQKHQETLNERLTDVLKEYFDPKSGHFKERITQLIETGGDLDAVLQRKIGREDSELCKTLADHFGTDSKLFNLLDPSQSEGLVATFRGILEKQLKEQRDSVLREFSLDAEESALSRTVKHITESQGTLTKDLQSKIDTVVKQFSLDEEESALSRLVKNVDSAQKRITDEFSLDNERSALCRLKEIIDGTSTAIHENLTLDRKDSALARLKRELVELLGQQSEKSQKFQKEMRETIAAMVARKEEAGRSVRHGFVFQDAVLEVIEDAARTKGDIATDTGNTSGLIPKRKVGDCVVEIGPDSVACGEKIVVEAKEDQSYGIKKATEEIELARKNRGAQVGLFVFSKKTAPERLERLSRFGNDVFVVWDAEDPRDPFLGAGFMVAKAMCLQRARTREAETVDSSTINAAIRRIEKEVESLDEIEKAAATHAASVKKPQPVVSMSFATRTGWWQAVICVSCADR